MRNIALLIEYDGTAYSGWQIQQNGRSIQGVIEKGLSNLFREDIKIVGAGRTDAGVHALGQVTNFKTKSEWEIDKLVYSLNGILPPDIAVKKAVAVPINFHSRFGAIGRKYVYRVITRKFPFDRRFAAHIRCSPSIDLMNEAASYLIGEKSFKSFTKYADQQRHFICKVTTACWESRSQVQNLPSGCFLSTPDLCFVIEANRFLHGMVRAIVGTLIDVGRGKISIEDFKRIIDTENRSYASMSAPACGLYLSEVKYGFDVWGNS